MEDTGFFKGIVRTAREIQVPKEVIDAFRGTQWDALQVSIAWGTYGGVHHVGWFFFMKPLRISARAPAHFF